MKGERFEKIKDAALALLVGYSASTLIRWAGLWQQICGIYLIAQVAWFMLIVYGEILRQRKEKDYWAKRNRTSKRG